MLCINIKVIFFQSSGDADKAKQNWSWDTSENARTEQRMKKMKEQMKNNK